MLGNCHAMALEVTLVQVPCGFGIKHFSPLPLSEQGVMPDQLWVSLTLPKRLTIIWTHFTWEWNINALENLFTGPMAHSTFPG